MRKLVKFFALFLAVVVGVVGFAGSALAADETYGMVVFLKGSEFFNWCYAGFQDAAATVGAKTELQGPADWDASGEAKAVEQLIAKQVKGIAVTAGDADTLVASINAAIAAKIPTLTFDSDSPKSNRMLFVGTDNYNSGYQAGKALGKALGDKARVISFAQIISAKGSIEQTERSIPPVMMTKVIPSAIIPSNMKAIAMDSTFSGERKSGNIECITRTKTTMKAIMARFCELTLRVRALMNGTLLFLSPIFILPPSS